MKKMANKQEGWITTRKERVSYIFAKGAYYGQYSLVTGTILTTFLMMIGMDMAAVAVVLLIIKVIDAADDLFIGYIIDKVNPHRYPKLAKLVGTGHYMPWIRMTSFLLPLAGILLYMMPRGMNDILKLTWFSVFYLAVDIAYTLVDVPGNAMITTLTPNMEERYHIQGVGIYPMLLATLVNMLPTVMISEQVGMSISIAVTLIIIVHMLASIPLVKNGKEYNLNSAQEEEKNYTIKEMWQYLKHNKYLALYYSSLIIRLVFGTSGAVTLFVCFYLFHNTLFSLIYALCSLPPMVIITAIAPSILKKVDSGKLFLGTSIIGIFSGILLYVAGHGNPALHLAIYFVNMIIGMAITVMLGFMCPNIVEYGKYKSGIDGTGAAFAVHSFAIKLGGAISSSLGIAILGLFGWVTVEAESFADLAAMNVTQTDTALWGLWFVNAGVPLIGAILATVLLFFYKLRDKDVKVMIAYNRGDITKEEAETRMSRKY